MKPINRWLPVVAVALSGIAIAGCARDKVRQHQEQVAKGWCETIRASQVVPVYPLTEDLRVGDVFLVRTPIAKQEAQYRDKGFLPLDDHRTRLVYTNFSKIYFPGYWKDDFGSVPHSVVIVKPKLTNESDFEGQTNLSIAPRVAFPTYSFQAQSGFGLSAAFPVQGIPVALNFLRSDQINGTVTITDARTYGGDQGELLTNLGTWASQRDVKMGLGATAENAPGHEIYLRVVTRVYLAAAVEVSLQRADQTGGGVKAGTVANIDPLRSDGNVNDNYKNLLTMLNSQGNSLLEATKVGGAAQFTSVSASTVGLAQRFDRLLAIGYLGIDVPVYENGELGTPIPTFQRLTSGAMWMEPMQRYHENREGFSELVKREPRRACLIMKNSIRALQRPEYDFLAGTAATLVSATNTLDWTNSVHQFHKEWQKANARYITSPLPLTPLAFSRILRKPNVQHTRNFNAAFSRALRQSEPTETAIGVASEENLPSYRSNLEARPNNAASSLVGKSTGK